MTIVGRQLVLLGMLLASGACIAQERESPKQGNAERGRILLSILGPKPHTASGISPLQQQELNRRVRCAATRQEIQDQLDFEAAGSPGFYTMSQLRAMEVATCTPVEEAVALPPLPQPAAQLQPVSRAPAQFRAPAQRVAQSPQPVAATGAQQSAPRRPPPPQQPVALAQQPPKPPSSNIPAYTPAPDYPEADKAAGHEGTVVVQLVINADGSVKDAAVAQSSTFAALDAAALNAARSWRIPAAAGRTINVPLKFSAH